MEFISPSKALQIDKEMMKKLYDDHSDEVKKLTLYAFQRNEGIPRVKTIYSKV